MKSTGHKPLQALQVFPYKNSIVAAQRCQQENHDEADDNDNDDRIHDNKQEEESKGAKQKGEEEQELDPQKPYRQLIINCRL